MGRHELDASGREALQGEPAVPVGFDRLGVHPSAVDAHAFDPGGADRAAEWVEDDPGDRTAAHQHDLERSVLTRRETSCSTGAWPGAETRRCHRPTPRPPTRKEPSAASNSKLRRAKAPPSMKSSRSSLTRMSKRGTGSPSSSRTRPETSKGGANVSWIFFPALDTVLPGAPGRNPRLRSRVARARSVYGPSPSPVSSNRPAESDRVAWSR